MVCMVAYDQYIGFRVENSTKKTGDTAEKFTCTQNKVISPSVQDLVTCQSSRSVVLYVRDSQIEILVTATAYLRPVEHCQSAWRG